MRLFSKRHINRKRTEEFPPEVEKAAWKGVDKLFDRYADGQTSDEESRMVEEIADILIPDQPERKKEAEKLYEDSADECRKCIFAAYDGWVAETEKKEKRSNSLKRYTGIAATVLLAMATGTFFLYDRLDGVVEMAASDQLVACADAKHFELPDGSVGWVKQGYLSVAGDYFQKTRTVHTVGRSYYEVEKNPEKPFIVEGIKIRARVLGTKFEVSSYDDISIKQLVVKEGEVEVSCPDSINTAVIDTLTAGYRIIYDTNAPEQYKILRTDVKEVGLEDGKCFTMDAMSPMELILNVRQIYDKVLVIDESAMKKIGRNAGVIANFRADEDGKITCEDVLDRIKALYGLYYIPQGNKQILLTAEESPGGTTTH